MRKTALLAALLVIAAACGAAEADSTTTTTGDINGGFPVTIDAHNGSVTIESRPERIVSISPTGTEMLFAVGAGDQVVAVDDLSYYPAGTPLTDLSAFEPSLEAIVAFDPDLVLASFDPGDALADGFDALDVPFVLYFGAGTIDDVYTQIRELGVATGNLELAETANNRIAEDLASIVTDTGGAGEGVTYLHDAGFPFVSSSSSFVGQVYALFGLVNVADEAPGAETGFVELSDEYVVDADPEIIFLSFEDPSAPVGERPGWSGISAVENGAVVALDPDTSSRWGPRIVDFARDVAASLAVHMGSGGD